jgi:hemerythrin-like metal-binding protein
MHRVAAGSVDSPGGAMQLIEWDESFSVGVKRFDADHQTLIELLNRLCQAWQAGKQAVVLEKLFEALTAYAAIHFEREEKVLAALEYEALGAHRAAHARLRTEIADFRKRAMVDPHAPGLTEAAAEFLQSWLLDHILGEDRGYRGLFENKKGEPA